MKKRQWLWVAILLVVVGVVTACGKAPEPKAEPKAQAAKASREIRIAYQTDSTVIKLAKAKGWYDEEFAKDGTTVKYASFLSGPPIIEGLSGDKQDIGIVGDMPPVTAKAAGVDLKVIARSGVVPFTNAVVIPPDSPIKSVADLKGKKVGLQLGSASHHLLVLLLQKEGIKVSDVNVVNLATSDQQAALESRNIDAVVTWEPWVAILENAKAGKVLVDQRDIKRHISVYILRNEFGVKNPDLVERFLRVNQKAIEYIKQHPDEVLEILSKESKLSVPILAKAFKATDWDQRILDADIEGFQKVKEFLQAQKVLKKDFDVKDLIDRSYLQKAGIL
ncbi:MAG TPA: aliphatic sulfonate ABC transporter substrate-binding protein [Negativicutes bacterium]|nr:aliphatic sulfonate ABC transporter substrate-binding protein [Negativicutes bacterium]